MRIDCWAGATNLTTGVGCAWLDRAPVLAITCNVATPWLERRIQCALTIICCSNR